MGVSSIEKYMNWREIEGVVYADTDDPKSVLGCRMTDEGMLVGAFLPFSSEVSILAKTDGKTLEIPMELMDEAGYYAALVPVSKPVRYRLRVTNDQGAVREIEDAYRFVLPDYQEEWKKFAAGIHYEIYQYLGAHPMVIDGVEGVYFALWAPEAVRASVVSDADMWDGRVHIMQKNREYGIFELFIPGMKPGDIYKYELTRRGGHVCLKADPYGFSSELRPNNASVIRKIGDYPWTDATWLEKQKKLDMTKEPMAIYELHLGSFVKPKMPEGLSEEEQKQFVPFYNYRELAPKIAEYVKKMGYTHIELMPIMEHPFDGSWGYQVTGYYAPTSRYGTPQDFMYFMDYMHNEGIGVILDWVPAHFPRDMFGLAEFDGTCLYEHKDPRQGAHPHWGTLIYNYGRPQVSNFLIANALFWVEQYHADGLRMDAVASMLYLDYGKNPGEWVANIYGGKENLEAIEFLKHLNSVFKKRDPGALLIAEESTAWPFITADVESDGLGFDFKWNMGWMNDFTGYMQMDPYFRKHNYGGLTFSMVYAYSENFILVLSHDEVVHGKASMINKMPGVSVERKMANLRAAYGFMACHPGKKLLFMGQDFGQSREWSEERSLDWEELEKEPNRQLQDYCRDLLSVYRKHPALFRMDQDPDGFEWINCVSAEESIVVFSRNTEKPSETLIVVCNFDTVPHPKRRIGVPFHGKYKEILNSDAEKYGGSGMTNPRGSTSKKIECDEREESIQINIAPLSVAILTATPVKEKPALEKEKPAPVKEKSTPEKGKSAPVK